MLLRFIWGMVAQAPQAYPEAFRNLAFFPSWFCWLGWSPCSVDQLQDTVTHHTHTHTHAHIAFQESGMRETLAGKRPTYGKWGTLPYSEGKFPGKNCSPDLHKPFLLWTGLGSFTIFITALLFQKKKMTCSLFFKIPEKCINIYKYIWRCKSI